MMENDLFRPTLTEENTEIIESYNIRNLFYVAFFGGIIPMTWLGTKNAKWLNINKKKINLLISIGILFLALKMGMVWMSYSEKLIIETRVIRWLYKGLSVILYFGYYLVMKKEFEQQVFWGVKIRPMFKDAILTFVASTFIETALVVIITLAVGVI